ncbi:MAG: DUF3047 domain-containing protein [Aquabacterium sp.]|nr:DUF3047 domain-containing protein [Aquabacterium sp.]
MTQAPTPAPRRGRVVCTAVCALAGALSISLSARANALGPLVGEGETPPPPWQFAGLPQQSLPRTQYRIAPVDAGRALRIEANGSYGNLVHALPADSSGRRLAWRWRVDEPNALADLRHKPGDDSAAKVCLLFDLPLSAVPFIERQLLRLARSRAAEALPAASVCYVWDARLAAGTVLDNAYSRRVRYLVLRGPDAPLRRWATEQRDVVADFLRLFGDETTVVPPLLAVAVAGDADNTRGRSLAWVDALTLD